MTFDEAKNATMRFGKYKDSGLTLDQIAETDDGLRHLDWAVSVAYGYMHECLTCYLGDKSIRKEVAKLR